MDLLPEKIGSGNRSLRPPNGNRPESAGLTGKESIPALPRYPRSSGGFSLMEGIAVLGVMAMLLIIISQIFIVSYDIYAKQTAKADNSTSAVLAARSISESARGAMEVLASHTVNGTVYTSSEDELILKLPAVNETGDIVADSYDYVAFYRDGTDASKIFSDTEADTDSYRHSGQKLVTAYNEVMKFRWDKPSVADAGRVSIYIRNSQIVRNTSLEAEAWTSIFLRNR